MRKIVMVLGASLVAAVLITSFFVKTYGPTGRYELTNVLLNPEILEKLNYNDWNYKINEADRFIFDKIVYEPGNKQIGLDAYTKIYQILKGDTSAEQSISLQTSSRLVLYVRTESTSAWQSLSKMFQQVQFSKDYYRVLLHEDNNGNHFIDFPHPGIQEKIETVISHG